MSKNRILIVEDDEAVASLEKAILEGEGFHVEIARDGIEGLEMISGEPFHVILSDFSMPRMKGDEFYLRVKALNQDLAQRIIFVTSTINDFVKSTGNKYLEKPFSNHHLIKTVKDFFVAASEEQRRLSAIDLFHFILSAKESTIGRAISEFSFKSPKVETIEEKDHIIKAYVFTSEGNDFPVMLTRGVHMCGCRDSFQKGEICKHVVVLAFYLMRERNS